MERTLRSLSGYRIVWLMLYFDLPVVSKKNRDSYVRFRNYLLDEGFEMAQFSVYLRHCASKEAASALTKRIEKELPPEGKVYIISITDKQFSETIRFVQTKRTSEKNPEQLALF